MQVSLNLKGKIWKPQVMQVFLTILMHHNVLNSFFPLILLNLCCIFIVALYCSGASANVRSVGVFLKTYLCIYLSLSPLFVLALVLNEQKDSLLICLNVRSFFLVFVLQEMRLFSRC